MSLEQKLFRGMQREVDNEEEAAERWRRVVLKLSNNLNAASMERADLSSVLMEALHHALENLLLLGDEADLMALEEWVDIEHAGHPQALTRQELRQSRGEERRVQNDRRCAERRAAREFNMPAETSNERRQNSDRRQTPDRRTQLERRAF